MTMKVIIVEDESYAAEKLERQLVRINKDIKVLAKLDSVTAAVAWLQHNQADLIFLDIHLGDSSSFKIFEQVEVKTPIIFTTAYDQYAIEALKDTRTLAPLPDYVRKDVLRLSVSFDFSGA